MFDNYSVLMCVYAKENPNHFKEAIMSILNQTKKTNDFVIVCDGPLTDELDRVLLECQQSNSEINVVRLEKNSGVGAASQFGLSFIKNEVLAKMDSDDISLPDRMEKELAIINQGFDVVGGGIAEFIDTPENIVGKRFPPQNQDEIIKFSKKRNPVNNVTIMYKKSQILEVGGYLNANYLEDYSLDIKLIQNGRKFYNIQDVVVYVRTNQGQMKRRGNKMLRKQLKLLRKQMLKDKYINVFEYVLFNIEGFIFLMSPAKLKTFLYKLFLRKH